MSDAPAARLSIRLILAPGVMLGPGKADLLEGIRETGSIAAAGRRMGMSYKRAWQLVETLNGYFDEPVVEAAKGGSGGGGARLTDRGQAVLEGYRRLVAVAQAAAAPQIEGLAAAVPPVDRR